MCWRGWGTNGTCFVRHVPCSLHRFPQESRISSRKSFLDAFPTRTNSKATADDFRDQLTFSGIPGSSWHKEHGRCLGTIRRPSYRLITLLFGTCRRATTWFSFYLCMIAASIRRPFAVTGRQTVPVRWRDDDWWIIRLIRQDHLMIRPVMVIGPSYFCPVMAIGRSDGLSGHDLPVVGHQMIRSISYRS